VYLGGNDFFGVPFPVVVADRFFNIYSEGNSFNVNVFRWDETNRQPVFEVLAGKPQQGNIDANPTGIVTFAHEVSGAFLFKFRPKPGVSQIFGRVPDPNEIEVRISDKRITVMRENITIATFTANQSSGVAIGIQVGADGSIGIATNRLPQGMVLGRK
jgi:hypothetical protein